MNFVAGVLTFVYKKFASKPSCKSVVINIPEIQGDHKPDDIMSVQSLFITLPEAIEVVAKSASVLW